jgi:hypothetical protein
MASDIEQLRAIASNESLAMDERRNAAALTVKLTDAAITSAGVADDDPEVLKFMKPWRRDTPFSDSVAEMFLAVGVATNGHTLEKSKAMALKRKTTQSRLAKVVDETLPRLEREAAAEAIKNDLPEHNKFSVNNIGPAGMVDTIKSAAEQLSRPLELSDVWVL